MANERIALPRAYSPSTIEAASYHDLPDPGATGWRNDLETLFDEIADAMNEMSMGRRQVQLGSVAAGLSVGALATKSVSISAELKASSLDMYAICPLKVTGGTDKDSPAVAARLTVKLSGQSFIVTDTGGTAETWHGFAWFPAFNNVFSPGYLKVST